MLFPILCRTMLIALFVGIPLVFLCYLLVNLAFFIVLSHAEILRAEAVALVSHWTDTRLYSIVLQCLSQRRCTHSYVYSLYIQTRASIAHSSIYMCAHSQTVTYWHLVSSRALLRTYLAFHETLCTCTCVVYKWRHTCVVSDNYFFFIAFWWSHPG